jgi:hypothetical protein
MKRWEGENKEETDGLSSLKRNLQTWKSKEAKENARE